MHTPSETRIDEVEGAYVRLYDLDAEWQSKGDDEPALSKPERDRAAGLKPTRDRKRYVQRCAFVRRALGALADVAPADIEFGVGTHGKPHIVCDDPSNERLASLQFNLARADNVLALAVAFGRPVGVDIEVVHPGVDVLHLAAQRFNESDNEMLRTLPTDAAVRAFYRLWTRHEALAKTNGAGPTVSSTSVARPDQATKVHSFALRVGGKEIVGALGLGSPRANPAISRGRAI